MGRIKSFLILVMLAILATLAVNTVNASDGSNIITINHSKTLDWSMEMLLIATCDHDCYVVKEETDKRSTALTEVDLNKVRFIQPTLKKGQTSLTGEERLESLKKTGYIRLDFQILSTIFSNQAPILKKWKDKLKLGNKPAFISFDGAILQDCNGDRYIPCLYWTGDIWSMTLLSDGDLSDYPAAVLTSVPDQVM